MATAFNNFDMSVIFYISKFNDGKSVHASVSHCALYLKKKSDENQDWKTLWNKGVSKKMYNCLVLNFIM